MVRIPVAPLDILTFLSVGFRRVGCLQVLSGFGTPRGHLSGRNAAFGETIKVSRQRAYFAHSIVLRGADTYWLSGTTTAMRAWTVGGTVRKGSMLISIFSLLVAALPAQASEAPKYDSDPFGDFDVDALPLILEQRFVSKGASELGALFQTSLIDRYSAHLGGLLDYTYFFTETVGLNVSGGYASGSLSGLVTGPEGVIGQAVTKCQQEPADCDLQPNLPDFKELTRCVGKCDLGTALR